MPEVKVCDSEKHIMIKIDGSMHLFVEWEKLVAIQSYESHEGKFCVDYYFQDAAPVTCEYPKALWKQVLDELEKVVWA